MKFKSVIAAFFAVALSCVQAFGQASLLPAGELCFQATAGINGMVGVLGTITGGSLYTNGSYGGVPLTGGSGTLATANITVSGGVVTQVTVLNPGKNYATGDVLSAAAANIGGTGSGFSVSILSTSINSSLAGGSVGFFIPTTQTPKQTWQNAGQTVLNQNPVPLDQNGCAVVYGVGTYLMVVQDSLGNVVYSKLTAATNGSNGIFWAQLSGGTGNAITVTDTAFALQDGYNLQFLAAAANTGPAFITVSGGSSIQIVKDTSSGPAALTGGEIGIGNTPMLTYDATAAEFHIVNPAPTSSSGGSSSSGFPQGYLNLVGAASGNIIQTGDVIGTGTIFYSPLIGNTIPIWNGTIFINTVFPELTVSLTASANPLSTVQDVCVFNNSGAPALVTGPSWTTTTSRGSGAGTAQLTRLQGIWVNAVSMTGHNGSSSFTIPASQCTYVGSISIDVTAAQVSAYRSYGQSRKNGYWNAYNRQLIVMQAGDSTSSWTMSGNLRPLNGNTANSIQVFAGLQEEPFSISAYLRASGGVSASQQAEWISAIGFNSTSAGSGLIGVFSTTNGSGAAGSISFNATVGSNFQAGATLGVSTITALEGVIGGLTVTATGTINSNMLTVQYRG